MKQARIIVICTILMHFLASIGIVSGQNITISEWKMLADGSSATLVAAEVTVDIGDSFYVEAEDRSAGIRVAKLGSDSYIPGVRATITGTIATDGNGQRYIKPSQIITNPGTWTILPLGLSGSSLGGGDWYLTEGSSVGQRGVSGGTGLNNVGLFVKAWGKPALSGSLSSFKINDGSNVDVTVQLPTRYIHGWTEDNLPDYVAVTGASGLKKVDGEHTPAVYAGIFSEGAWSFLPEGTWNVGSEKQLFIDHRFIESSQNITLNVNPPVKRDEPVLVSDKPWDAFRLIFANVVQNGDEVRLYYHAFDDNQWAPSGPLVGRLCLAVSQDGIHFTKPELGIVNYKGSTANNILMEYVIGTRVFYDPNGTPEQRWKLIAPVWPGELRVGVSPDGIHWTMQQYPATTQSGLGYDIQWDACWDEVLGKYVVYPRVMYYGGTLTWPPLVQPIASDPPVFAPQWIQPLRAIGRIELDSFLGTWPVAQNTLLVLAADEKDPADSDLYTVSAQRCPDTQDAWFMLFMTYQHFKPGEYIEENDGINDIQFAASRDGIHWMRYDRRTYIGRGLPGEDSYGIVQPMPGLVQKGNYVYHYYMTWPWTHGGFRELTPEEQQNPANWGRELYRVAVQRMDGFVSADAPYNTGGWLVTPPMAFAGDHLELNIDVSAMGEARVEIQNQYGNPIPGFTLADCNRILFNSVTHTVKWDGSSDIASLAGTPIRLKIAMRSAKLFAFQFK